MKNLRKLLDLLTPDERRRAAILLGMILVMALLEVVGVASIMPFMAVLASAEVIETNPMLARVYLGLGFTSSHAFLLFLGTLVFVVLLVSIAFKALTTYAQLRFTAMREYSIGRRLVTGYLHQPYTWFLNRHSADLGKSVLSEVSQVTVDAMMPMLQLIAHGAVAVALLTFLIAVNPWLAIVVGGTLGLAYGLIYKFLRGYLARIGAERLQANQARFSALSEAFGGIKEVKVAGLEEPFIRRFARPAKRFASHHAAAKAIALLPRYALEALAFGGLLLVVLVLLTGSGEVQVALPVIALYAFAGYRLMPALQAVYNSITTLRFAGPALNALHADLTQLVPTQHSATDTARMALSREITLEDISYTYPNATKPSLLNVSLTIPVNSIVGLVGATGSGKTSLVDLILGLLEPDRGTLAVDGSPIGAGNRRKWQRTIGYVPQHIYLSDDTVAANIAFGVPSDQIDKQAVERAARIAKLHDFVVNELSHGYATTVGERGVRLSGGQRQRIGVARALYHEPKVLILDEATSALDNLTEQAVMDAVHELGHEITIILISHRLSTVRECDQIYLMRQGRLAGQGTYDELMQGNETFRAMTAL